MNQEHTSPEQKGVIIPFICHNCGTQNHVNLPAGLPREDEIIQAEYTRCKNNNTVRIAKSSVPSI